MTRLEFALHDETEAMLQPHEPAFIDRIRTQPGTVAELDALQLELQPVRHYIAKTWRRLVRNHSDLFRDALFDPKVPRSDQDTRLLYISAKQDEQEVRDNLNKARAALVEKITEGRITDLKEDELPEIEIRRLPPMGQKFSVEDGEHSLMYLPFPYVVPGPRFNEMYNWDTAFVIRGLLQDEKFDLAKAAVENMFYQIEHYGTILNGNRTYYYDSEKSRSQPPLHTGKILGIYNNFHKLRSSQSESKLEWLKRALRVCEIYYQHWVTKPHYHEASGLSMYGSELDFPAFEVTWSEKGHYYKALTLLRGMYHKQDSLGWEEARLHLHDYQDRKDRYYLEQYYIPAKNGEEDKLSPAFYRGDRAMRETGFDPSRRFGFFNIDVINYLPVCLNSLRHKIEREMGLMYWEVTAHEPDGTNEKGERWYDLAKQWEERAGNTATLINEWLWDGGEKDASGHWVRTPCYRDYNVNEALCQKYGIPAHRDYDFVTAFYPMWVGIASREQAEALVKHLLPRLQTQFGILTSSRETGSQWDKPFMWAPLVMVAVEALERYDYYRQSLEIASAFLRVIIKDFAEFGKLYEKYDGLRGTSDVSTMIHMGYSENVEGFAWTNSVILELSHAVERLQRKLHGEPLHCPDILTQLTVIEQGVARPQYDEQGAKNKA